MERNIGLQAHFQEINKRSNIQHFFLLLYYILSQNNWFDRKVFLLYPLCVWCSYMNHKYFVRKHFDSRRFFPQIEIKILEKTINRMLEIYRLFYNRNGIEIKINWTENRRNRENAQGTFYIVVENKTNTFPLLFFLQKIPQRWNKYKVE